MRGRKERVQQTYKRCMNQDSRRDRIEDPLGEQRRLGVRVVRRIHRKPYGHAKGRDHDEGSRQQRILEAAVLRINKGGAQSEALEALVEGQGYGQRANHCHICGGSVARADENGMEYHAGFQNIGENQRLHVGVHLAAAAIHDLHGTLKLHG